MGVLIFIIVQSILALALFAGIIYGAVKFIDQTARPEAKDQATVIVFALGGLTCIGSLIMAFQFTGTSATITTLNWEKHYCDNASEIIYKTVENVRGVYYLPPNIGHDGNRFHQNDGDHRAYLARPGRLYEFFEVRRNPSELVEHFEVNDNKVVSKRQDAPTARYAFTWSPITTEQDSKVGVYGEELEVFDRETGEVLGRRTLFYYAPAHQSQPYGMPIPVCPQTPLKPDIGFVNGQPQDSYQFVSRILKPPALSPEDRARIYDLFKGSGNRSKRCIGYAWIGDGVKPEELAFSRTGQDLHIKIAATGDSLTCREYFFSGSSSSKYAPLRFADGSAITTEEFRNHFPPTSTR
jgi:hypothetical protein